jgi:hypothetical protein
MSPQGDLIPLVVHSPHSTTQKPGSTPTTVPIHQLSLFPTTCTTQGMYPLHCSQSLRLYHSFIRASSALGWPRISQLGTSGTLNCFRSAHNNLHKALEPFPQQENALQAYNLFYRHTCLISSIKHNQTMVSFKHIMVGALPNTQLFSCLPKICMQKLSSLAIQISFSPSQLTLTLPNVDCTSAPCSPITMGCDSSHPPSYMK